MGVLSLVLRGLLAAFAVFALLFSALFDSNLTALLYLLAAGLAVYGLFQPRASVAALVCILIAAATSWGGGNPGH